MRHNGEPKTGRQVASKGSVFSKDSVPQFLPGQGGDKAPTPEPQRQPAVTSREDGRPDSNRGARCRLACKCVPSGLSSSDPGVRGHHSHTAPAQPIKKEKGPVFEREGVASVHQGKERAGAPRLGQVQAQHGKGERSP